MIKLCPKCGEKLTDDYYCNNCELTIELYEKIINTSKLLYNQGLQMAKLRDLSGAISVLKRSIKLDKYNIEAHNLLGLIYFEIGEVVQALQQWVISKNMKKEDNLAEKYIEDIHHNQQKLDKLNSAVKKYNQSIKYIEQKSEDLAIIQLKKVISLNPKFVKAYCLLSLCYIKEKEVEKAKKYLIKVLAIDKSNYIALKYYESITDHDDKIEEIVAGETKDSSPVNLSPSTKISYRFNSATMQFIYIIVGILIGVAVGIFLIVPGRTTHLNKKVDALELENEQLTSNYSQSLADLTTENETLKNEVSEKDAMIANQNLQQEYYEALETLQDAIDLYMKNEREAAFNELDNIEKSHLGASTAYEIYNRLTEELALDAYNSGYNAYVREDFEKSRNDLRIAYNFVQDTGYSDDALYLLARSYQRLGNDNEAIRLFKELISKYPSTNRINDANYFLNNLES